MDPLEETPPPGEQPSPTAAGGATAAGGDSSGQPSADLLELAARIRERSAVRRTEDEPLLQAAQVRRL
jgi:hypothetical protein